MDLGSIRDRLNRLAAAMPSVSSTAGAPERNAERLACIEAAPNGPARDFAIEVCVYCAAGVEEPEDFAALLAAIGPERIAAVFPAGVPGQPIADVRARARAYRVPAGTIDPITAMVRAQLAQVPENNTQHERPTS
jgi:hypothetical protein